VCVKITLDFSASHLFQRTLGLWAPMRQSIGRRFLLGAAAFHLFAVIAQVNQIAHVESCRLLIRAGHAAGKAWHITFNFDKFRLHLPGWPRRGCGVIFGGVLSLRPPTLHADVKVT
jgi:hypothetical protein